MRQQFYATGFFGSLFILMAMLLSSCSNNLGGAGGSSDVFDWLTDDRTAKRERHRSPKAIGEPRSIWPIRGYIDEGEEGKRRLPSTPGGASGIFPDGKKVSVNFVKTELQEFVRAVFEDVLKKNYTIDPRLKGTITIRTSTPITKQELLQLTRQALAANGARLRLKGSTYHVTARRSDRENPPTRVVQVSNVSPEKLAAELKIFVPTRVQIIPSPAVGGLILKGPTADIEGLQSIIETFDIDRMKGMSFALIPITRAPAQAVSEELTRVLGAGGDPGATVLPIARMNAVLVIARRRTILRKARKWVKRLDQQLNTEVKSYVYAVQNRPAADLANVLRTALIEGGASSGSRRTRRASTTVPATGAVTSTGAPSTEALDAAPAAGLPRITADPGTNSLVIFSTPEQYRAIRAAIYRLDVVPMQVLIEATLAEVHLNHSLRHGVSWFLKNKNIGASFTSDAAGAVTETYPGLNIVIDVPNGRFVLSALEGETDVEVIATPSMTVIDNQTARLQVGDQVPIATRSAVSTTAGLAPIVNTIELKDTGIILSVTPRVNASGLVVLNIVQEASHVVATTTSGIDSPTIRQRKFESRIAVPDGTPIVLGGLISRRKEIGDSGVPVVKDIPLIGDLFKSRSDRTEKIELIAIIRPTVIRNRKDIRSIAKEFRRKMSGIRSMR